MLEVYDELGLRREYISLGYPKSRPASRKLFERLKMPYVVTKNHDLRDCSL